MQLKWFLCSSLWNTWFANDVSCLNTLVMSLLWSAAWSWAWAWAAPTWLPHRADSRFAPNQWETALLCNDVSHWLGASLESALPLYLKMSYHLILAGHQFQECPVEILPTLYKALPLFATRFAACAVGIRVSFMQPHLFKIDIKWLAWEICHTDWFRWNL